MKKDHHKFYLLSTTTVKASTCTQQQPPVTSQPLCCPGLPFKCHMSAYESFNKQVSVRATQNTATPMPGLGRFPWVHTLPQDHTCAASVPCQPKIGFNFVYPFLYIFAKYKKRKNKAVTCTLVVLQNQPRNKCNFIMVSKFCNYRSFNPYPFFHYDQNHERLSTVNLPKAGYLIYPSDPLLTPQLLHQRNIIKY